MYQPPHLTSGLKPYPTYGDIKPYPFVPLNKQQQKRAKMAMIEVLAVCTKMSQK